MPKAEYPAFPGARAEWCTYDTAHSESESAEAGKRA